MKRFATIIVSLFTFVLVASGQYKTPPELTFTDTRMIPDSLAGNLKHIVRDWYEIQDRNPYIDYSYNDYFIYYCRNAPDFKTSSIFVSGEPCLGFKFKVEIYRNHYIAKVYEIYSGWKPMLGILYGEHGKLFPELYTKKQLKHSIPVIEYVQQLSDELFLNLWEYVSNYSN